MSNKNPQSSDYLPIEQYGIIGNLRTCALVGSNGSLDFFCYPKFDSPSIFLKLLDRKKGGYFSVKPLNGTDWSNADIKPQNRPSDADIKLNYDNCTPDGQQNGVSNNSENCTDKFTSRQQYFPMTNVLLTKFLSESSVGELSDFMPMPRSEDARTTPVLPWIFRKIDVIRGKMTFKIECFPAFDYARAPHEVYISSGSPHSPTEEYPEHLWTPDLSGTTIQKSIKFRSANRVMELLVLVKYTSNKEDYDFMSPCPRIKWNVERREEMMGPGVVADITLFETQQLFLVFRESPTESPRILYTANICLKNRSLSKLRKSGVSKLFDPPFNVSTLERIENETHQFWIDWVSKCKYTGRWREVVLRSALTLKLLTYAPTGAVVASPTFGLPEGIGGERNWDYRFSWVRDSAFTVYALLRVGFTDEARDYWKFMERRCQELNRDNSLEIMYTIDGGKETEESILDHLEGYKGSKPVRIGNAAQSHLQLDIYGELLDAAYLYNKFGVPISYDLWVSIRKLVNYVCEHWKEPDMSIWEVRGEKKNFTYSKVMCWVAVDRGLRLSEKRTLPCPDREKWLKTRDIIYEDIMEKGFSKQRHSFVQSYESTALDCACLIMPLVFFISPADPRLLKTLEQIMKPPERGGLLVNNLCLRYDISLTDDGLRGVEGTFAMCTFWLVEALTRAGRYSKDHLSKALLIFEQALSYASPLGLFSEEVAKSGELLGNFPQAFTHISLISAAFNLDRVLNGKNGIHETL